MWLCSADHVELLGWEAAEAARAAKLGLDVARFDQALDDGRERARVQSDLELGKRVGVRGVPATVIGDELLPGALSIEELVRHIDRALATKHK